MKQEDKELLLKDLCARFPHDVIVERLYIPENNGFSCELSYRDFELLNDDNWSIKPYLRPMSSMTKEEKYTYRHMLGATLNSEGESIMFVYVEDFPTVIDWLNAHYFDYRGLIEKGLALEAPEGMYRLVKK
jgi:hypothetical protein